MENSELPYTADNTVWWPNTKRVLNHNACQLVNHHPNIQGGMDWMMLSAAAAERQGIDNIVGSSGNFGIQNAAFQAMSGITGLKYPCEEISLTPYYKHFPDYYEFSHNPSLLVEDVAIDNGTISLPDKPGLGVEVDMNKLESVKTWEFHCNA